MAEQYKGLVPVLEQVIGGAKVAAVDGRELHKALGVRKVFANWAKQQIGRLRYQSGRDYQEDGVIAPEGKNPRGGRPSGTYWFTLDAAKHIAMMANTERGFEVREYFIECERKLHAPVTNQSTYDPVPMAIAQDPAWAAWLSLPAEERRTRQRDMLLAKQAGGTAMMRWAMWNSGYPIPPHYLLGAREQFEMDLHRRGAGQGQSILIAVNQVGGAH